MALFNYPPPAFCFSVSFGGDDRETSFQEVSGLKAEFVTEDVVEGGQNRFVHRLPVRTRYSNLVLKRGVVVFGSRLANWLSGCFDGGLAQPVARQDVIVLLLNGKGDPLIKWWVHGAWPVTWEHSPLQSSENEVLAETIELSCDFVERSAP
jgi:phage tail-like protein